MSQLIPMSIALVAGLLMTRVFKKLHLNFPDVTAFLIAGLAIGPYGLGSLHIGGLGFSSLEAVNDLSVISSVALGFIAFSIGNEFRLSQLKETGRQAAVIGVLQALMAMVLVDAALLGLHLLMPDVLSAPAAITLGAIATATAPAATLMVVRQYKAKGKLTDLLLPIVALDDAVGLVTFAVSFGVATALHSGSVNLLSILVEPLLEIVGSLLLGSLMGLILTLLEKLFFSNSNRLSLTIAFVVMTIALSGMEFQLGPVKLGFSNLLVCMMLGTVFCNLCPRSPDIMERSDRWTVPLYALFFVLSGAELDLSVFSSLAVVGIGVVYILTRSAGKYLGARGSAAMVNCDHSIRKYLGITLLPQAGVALGMSAASISLGAGDGKLIRNIVLFSVLIYELVGPSLTRWALMKSGDIRPVEPEKQTYARFKSKADR
ncbi:MAG: cation:proton antiporter [Clostridiaceae bacterium]|nr:cation:proton antiporter [Clostridia bacterium]MDY3870512.1 cation:proton antiporter [Clostridiaceae bacterium]